MAKKLNYEAMFTRRKDGRWQKVVGGKCLIDKDPEKLMQKILALENPPEKTFGLVAAAWREYHFSRIAYKTAEAYTAPLRYMIGHFGDEPITKITPMQAQAYISDLAKRGYARRTVQMHHDILRMIFNFAVLHGDTTTNPIDAVSIPNGLKTEKRQLPTDRDIEVIKAAHDNPFGLFAYFLLFSGLRRGELLALEYEDIDFKARLIHVTKAVSFEGNTPIIKSTKTDAGTRDVVLLDVLADKLEPTGTGLVFSDKGKLLTKTQFRKRWAKYLAKAGITITPHQLRHGFATMCYDAQIDEKAAQMLLGHSSIVVTKNIYTHIRQSRVDGVAAALNDFASNR